MRDRFIARDGQTTFEGLRGMNDEAGQSYNRRTVSPS
jgi:hypothetical protein